MDQSIKDSKREGTEQGNPPREETRVASPGMSGGGGPHSGGEKLAESAFTGHILLMGRFTHLRRKHPGFRLI